MRERDWLTDTQMEWLVPFFPKSPGKPRADDRRVLSGIIFIQRNGLMWTHASTACGPPKTLSHRWKRRSRMGVFATIMTERAAQAQETGGTGDRDRDDRCDPCEGASDCIEPDDSKGGRGRLIGRTKGGLNAKLHVVADAQGRPIRMLLSAGQTSDDMGGTGACVVHPAGRGSAGGPGP